MLSCGDGAADEISPDGSNSTFLSTQHSANYVELHIIGGASTVTVETTGDRAFNLDGAQRAVQSKGEFTQADWEGARMRFGGMDKLQ